MSRIPFETGLLPALPLLAGLLVVGAVPAEAQERSLRAAPGTAPSAGQPAPEAVPPALATALEEFEDGRYLLVRDRLRPLRDGGTSLSPEDRAAALWLDAASAARMGRVDGFRRALSDLRRDAPESPFRYLAELELLMAPDAGSPDARAADRPALSGATVEGATRMASLVVAGKERDASLPMRARLFGEAASLGGAPGAVASYQAGWLWRRAGRPDSAATAFGRARSAGGTVGRLALVGQAEAILVGGDPEGALAILESVAPGRPSVDTEELEGPLEGARARALTRLRTVRHEIRRLLETQKEIVELEIELRRAEAHERDETARAIAVRLDELRARLEGERAGPETVSELPPGELHGGPGASGAKELEARVLSDLRDARVRTRRLLETQQEIVDLEIRLRRARARGDEAEVRAIAARLDELRSRLAETGGPDPDARVLAATAPAEGTDAEIASAALKVRARALARLGRTAEAGRVLEDARRRARTVAGRAEAEILLADPALTTGDAAGARALFADVRQRLEEALASTGDGTGPDPSSATRPVVDLGALVRRWTDRATRTLVTRGGARELAGAGLPSAAGARIRAADRREGPPARRLASLWSMPEAPAVEEARVRSALWLVLDARLDALRGDLLGSARGLAAARALERLGAEPDTDSLEELEEAESRAQASLALLLGLEATGLDRTFRSRMAALEEALSRSRELRSALQEGSRPSVGPDAPLVATRPRELLLEMKRTRARTRDLLNASHDLVQMELALAHAEGARERGRVALEVARTVRRMRARLDSASVPRASSLPDSATAADGATAERWSRAASQLAGRGESALVAAPEGETAEAVRTIHETAWRARTGSLERSRAVGILRTELEEAASDIRRGRDRAGSRERAARAELQRALDARKEAVESGPDAPDRLARERLAAALQTARFGEASASFFAALDATGDEAATALDRAIRLHRSFAEDHPDSPLRSTALLQLAELEARTAEARFAARFEQGPRRRVAGERPSPEYEEAIASLERTLAEGEGEERTVALQSLGYLLFQQGRYEEAADRLAAHAGSLDEDDPRRPEALFRQGDAVFAAAMDRSGDARMTGLADASELYRRAARSATSGSEIEILALYKLGWSRYLRDEYESAAQAFGTLLDRYADFRDEGLRPLDLSDEVTEYAALSLSQLPSPVERTTRFAGARPAEYEYAMFRSLARTLAEQGRLPDAVEALRTYRERRPLHPEALEAQETQLRLVESELADSARAQDARLELLRRFGPGSEWWDANPEVRDSAVATVGRILREAAHYRMRQAAERDDPELFRRAGELYLRYAESLPENDSTRAMRYMAGEAFFEAGDHVRAGDAYRAAAYEDPGELGPEKEAGLNAVAAYRRALEAEGSGAEADAEAARRLYDAVDRFVEAFPEAEEIPRALRTRAEVAFRRDDLETARASYESLIERFPDSNYAPRAHKLLGDIAYRVGNHDRAFELWDRAEAAARRANQPDLAGEVSGLRAEASLSLADSLAGAGDLERSAERYLEFARSHPEDERAPSAYGNAADVLVEAGRRERAVQVLAELLEEHPRHDGAFDAAVHRAELLAELGREGDAVEAYRRIEEEFSERDEAADVLLRMAELQQEAGDRGGAAESWVRFQRSRPDDARSPDALFSAARTLEETGHSQGADELYAEVTARYPDHRRAVDAAARRFELRRKEATGPVDEARRSLLETAEAAPDDAVEPHRRLVGLAHVEAAEDRFEAYREIRFRPSELTEEALRSERARKDRALEEIVAHLEAAVATGAAEPVSRGLYLLGEAYAAYGDFLRDVELPEGTGDEVRATVEESTAELARRYDERAREPWTRLVDLGREKPREMDLDPSTPGTQNRWIDRAEQELNPDDGRTT